GRDEGYDEGHEIGYDEGHEIGYDEGHEIGYDEGHKDGAEQKELEVINNMIRKKYEISEIAECLNLGIYTVEKIVSS
ncbi:MAG TPA: hypothetical protein DCY94_04445, partial [Firmicutes bacterium]|nr:hypothetical protein [Bacillota bacterium]